MRKILRLLFNKVLLAKIKSDSGQMTIFVALIFQVLFVFFAMTINIGLIVHDKINLQNSVDLGTYYGAQKMAEVMNAIAHINYQMRQDYKLLTYRLRVVGGLGLKDHPTNSGGRSENREFLGEEGRLAPVCISYQTWKEIREGDNICRNFNHRIRDLPQSVVLASFIPLAGIAAALSTATRSFITEQCESNASLNWEYAARAILSYRAILINRKEAIRALATNLSRPADRMLDMDGDRIIDGIQKTILNNLTDANRESFGGIETFNGLTRSQVVNGVPSWLSEKLITPRATYLFHEKSPTGGGCNNFVRDVLDIGGLAGASTGLLNGIKEPPDARGHSSLGFEKNPWIMAYIGVKASSSPRKPFAPFGQSITMTARSFAKPFGGKIGPWHKKTWPRGASSTGFGAGEIDTVAVPRVQLGEAQETPISKNTLGIYIPNFAKYPGDQLGMKSELALGFIPNFNRGRNSLALSDFLHFNGLPNNQDPLSFNPQMVNNLGNRGGVARTMERAAIAPNLFDVTYYSIEPRYENMYGGVRRIWNQLLAPDGRVLQAPKDLGYLSATGTPTNVKNQVEHLNRSNRRGNHFYFINNWAHMLTGWHQKRESDFTLDSERLGKCKSERPDNIKAPFTSGDCIVGGRTGYSVKFISLDYLNFESHTIGGEGSAPGKILNPPPENF